MVVVSIVLAALAFFRAAPAFAIPVAGVWDELDASATAATNGLSREVAGVESMGLANVSVAVGADGRPVVAYVRLDGAIIVKRFTGSTWQAVGGPVGTGFAPQIRIHSPSTVDHPETIFVAWLADVSETVVELYLKKFDGTNWVELGGSATGGGITAIDDAIAGPFSFSLALGGDGNPVVAYDAATTAADPGPEATNWLSAQQIYVRRYAGLASGWTFVPAAADRTTGGASGAMDFRADGDVAGHQAAGPALAIDGDDNPVAAWFYTSRVPSIESGVVVNADVFVTKFVGGGWQPVGPGLPTSSDDPVARGGPGGVSNNSGHSSSGFRPPHLTDAGLALALRSDGRPVVAWGDTSSGSVEIYVRSFDGAGWVELGTDSASGGGISQGGGVAAFPSMVVGSDGQPVVAWEQTPIDASSSHVHLRRFNGTAWVEHQAGSAAGAGISAAVDANAVWPSLAVSPDGKLSVAWIDASPDEAQIFLRTTAGVAPRPDLIVQVSAPASATTGRAMTVTTTVRNVGNRAAAASTVAIFLTADPVAFNPASSASYVARAQRSIASLAAGASSTANTPLMVPAAIAEPGLYTIVTIVDPANVVMEQVETNNRVQAEIGISVPPPDVVATLPVAPAFAGWGEVLNVPTTVRNIGQGATGPFTVRLYLSRDAAWNPAEDISAGFRTVANLAPGATSALPIQITIPNDATLQYRLILVADPLEALDETNRLNNVAASARLITIEKSDLVPGLPTAPSVVGRGQSLNVGTPVRNAGRVSAGPSTIRVYLSRDATLSGDDVEVGSRDIGTIAAGATSAVVTPIVIPGTAVGQYRVLVVADADDVLEEAAEGNNVTASAGALTIARPDLVPLPPAVAPIVFRGAGSVTTAVRNAGRVAVPAATPFTVKVYLSRDATKNDEDLLVGTRTVAGLAIGATSSAPTPVVIPNTALGQYRVLVVVDLEDAVTEEASETNNVMASAAPVKIGRPDLVPAAPAVPSIVFRGVRSVTTAVKNAGQVAVPATTPFTVRLYLSRDATKSDDDLLIGTRTVAGLAVGVTSSVATPVVIPNTATGQYRVVVVADLEDTVTDEGSETNNAVASSATTIGLPDFTVNALSAPPNARAGSLISLTVTVRNGGTAAATNLQVKFYLSTDGTLDAGDVEIATRTIATLAARQQVNLVVGATIPPGQAAARYRVIAVTDPGSLIDELTETNNSRLAATMTTVAP